MRVADGGSPVLELLGIAKQFEGVRALAGVDLAIRAGEVIGLVGENGAGKSTLLRVLNGDHQPDAGELLLDGQPRRFGSPRDAQLAGVRVIYQEPELVGSLTVAENIVLGDVGAASGGGALVRWRSLWRSAADLIERYGFADVLDPHSTVDTLGPAQRQLVEIIKALHAESRVLALDEPTSSLSEGEAERLLRTVEQLRRGGVAIIYVSHRLQEVRRLADRVVVLRDGQLVAERAALSVDDDELIRLMVGRPLGAMFERPRRAGPAAPDTSRTTPDGQAPRLRVDRLRTGWLRDVSFTIRSGEILGVAGLVGAGRTELARALFGAVRVTGGRVEVDGVPVRATSPRAALAAGLSMTPEDRRGEALVLARSVRENLTLTALPRLRRLRVIRRGRERRLVTELVNSLRIKAPSTEHPVSTLSGGNQQKVVVGRALSGEPKVLVLDEPTRGVDVGAKAEIYRLIVRQAEQGIAVLLISSELPEILGLSDRILVLSGGRVTGELSAAEATEDRVLALAMPPDATPMDAGPPARRIS